MVVLCRSSCVSMNQCGPSLRSDWPRRRCRMTPTLRQAGRQAVSNGAEGAADDGRGGGGSPVGRQRASSAALFWAVSKSGKDHHGVRRGEAALRVATYTQCATRRVPLSLTGASTLPQAQKGTARGARRFLTLLSFGRRPLGSRDPSPIVLPSALGAGAGRNACLRGAAVGWQSPMNMRDAENSRLASPRTPAHRALCALLPLSERARGYREQNPTFLRPIHVGTPPVERKLVSLRAPAIDARGIPDARGAGGADRIVRKAPKQRSVGGPRRRRAQTETAAQTFHSRGLPFVFVGHRVVGAGASHTGVTLARPHVEARAVRGLWRRGWMGGGASWTLWARRGAPRVCRLTL